PQVYGIGEARFSRHHRNGKSMQWNLTWERMLGRSWQASVGYSASASSNLIVRSYPLQNLQSIPADVLAEWRDIYIASNGTLNPATEQVANPFQPTTGDGLPFSGVLGNATLPRQNALFPYPHLVGSNAAINTSDATGEYHALL